MSIVFPLAAFGSLGYVQQVIKHDGFVFDIHEHFPKQTLRNRYTILGPQGEMRLSIPIEKPNGSKTSVKDILISNDSNWRVQHLRALKTAYSAAPFYEYYSFDVEAIFNKKHRFLLDFNLDVFAFYMQTIGLNPDFKLSESYVQNADIDFRNDDFNLLNTKTDKKSLYQHVFFGEELGIKNVSFLDCIFCEGPMAKRVTEGVF